MENKFFKKLNKNFLEEEKDIITIEERTGIKGIKIPRIKRTSNGTR